MDYFLTMGNFRFVALSFLLIPFLLFSEFEASDSSNLASIYEYVGDIRSSVSQLERNVSLLQSDVSTLNSINNSSGLSAASLSAIEYFINYNLSTIPNPPGHSGKALVVHDYAVNDSLQRDVLPALYNLTNIASVVENLSFPTNSFSYPTNYFASIVKYPYKAFFNSTSANAFTTYDTYLTRYFENLFGHAPTASELESFKSAYLYNGDWISFESELLALYDPSVYPTNKPYFYGTSSTGWRDYQHFLSGIDSRYQTAATFFGITTTQAKNSANALKDVGRVRFYQYGTRPLINAFDYYTNYVYSLGNGVTFTNGVFHLVDRPSSSASLRSSSSASKLLEFTTEITNNFGSISSAFVPNVNFDVPPISEDGTETNSIYHSIGNAVSSTVETYEYTPSTNNIVPLKWDSFSESLDSVKNQLPDHDSDVSRFWDHSKLEDNTFVSEVKTWEGNGTGFYLDFDLPLRPLSSSSTTNKHLNVPDVHSSTDSYVAFFLALIKAIIATFFINKVYNNFFKTVAAIEDSM